MNEDVDTQICMFIDRRNHLASCVSVVSYMEAGENPPSIGS